MTDRFITVKTGRAFSADPPNAGYTAWVTQEGTIYVWDSVAGHYTTCHSLTECQERYCRRNAR
jgi:hypothetical protein